METLQMRLGAHSLYYRGLPLVEVIRRLADAGCRDMEISWDHIKPIMETGDDDDSAKLISEIKETAKNAGVKAWQIHSPSWGLASFDETIRTCDLQISANCLRYCRLLDVPFLVIHPGGYEGFASSEELKKIRELNVESFSYLAARAGELGVKVLLENVCDTGCRRRRWYGSLICELKEIIHSVGYDSLGINLDLGHLNVQRLSVAQAIIESGELLCSTHIHDNWGDADQHLFPYEGNINWEEIWTAFRTIDYKGPFILEVNADDIHHIALKAAKLASVYRSITQRSHIH